MDITKLPTHELIDDRAASLMDIKVCELAMLHDIYSGGSVLDRLTVNQKIADAIEAELKRRGQAREVVG